MMDRKDLQLIELLQQDASTSLADLAEAVNLSQTPCWRRVQRLRDEGIVEKQVFLCNAEKMNLGVTAFVSVRASHHSEEWMTQFVEKTQKIPEIVEIHRLAGDVDYLLKVVATDIKGYDQVYKKLIRDLDLFDVSAGFSMEVIKYTTALPTTHLA